jgi:sterol desaturase/sphingolipid hydroxylase (fatty acid hydroxylase superfamily)
MLCTAYYALPLALFIACSYLTQSLMPNHHLREGINAMLIGWIIYLVTLLSFILPQSPIRRWVIGRLVQEHRRKWDVSLLIFLVIVLLLVLSFITLNLFWCLNWNYSCGFDVSAFLILWLALAFTTGVIFAFLYANYLHSVKL